jgi:hypothetical protein
MDGEDVDEVTKDSVLVKDVLTYSLVPNSPNTQPSWAVDVFGIHPTTGVIYLKNNVHVDDSMNGMLVQKDFASKTVNYESQSVFKLDISVVDDGGCSGRKLRDPTVDCNPLGRDDCCSADSLSDPKCDTDHMRRCDPNLSTTSVATIQIIDVNEPPRVNEGEHVPSIKTKADCEAYNPHGEKGQWNPIKSTDADPSRPQSDFMGCTVPVVFAVEENRELNPFPTAKLGTFEGQPATHTLSGSVEGTTVGKFNLDTQNCVRDLSRDGGNYMQCVPARVIARDDDALQECGKTDKTEVCDYNKHLKYHIVGGTGKDLFYMNNVTGQLHVSKKGSYMLNYEVQSQYTIEVNVTDSGRLANGVSTIPLYHVRTVIVQIIDINEHPVISPDTVFEVAENLNVGQFVATVTAVDNDFVYTTGDRGIANVQTPFLNAEHRQLTFSFESITPVQTRQKATGNFKNAFAIDVNGTITIANDIVDFEDIDEYRIIVRVDDDGGFDRYQGVLYATTMITIRVTDVVDPVITDFTATSIDEGVQYDGNKVKMTTRGGDRVNIVGRNFGSKWHTTHRYKITAKYGAREALVGSSDAEDTKVYDAYNCSMSIAYTQITCTTVAGVGAQLKWIVTIEDLENPKTYIPELNINGWENNVPKGQWHSPITSVTPISKKTTQYFEPEIVRIVDYTKCQYDVGSKMVEY